MPKDPDPSVKEDFALFANNNKAEFYKAVARKIAALSTSYTIVYNDYE
jgi:hypothetical protein